MPPTQRRRGFLCHRLRSKTQMRMEWAALRRVVEQGAEQTRAFQSDTHQQIEAMEDKIDEMSGRMDDMGGKLDKLFELLRQPK